MWNVFAKLFKVLNSEESPQAIGWAIALAFCFSMLPVFSLAKWIVLLVVAFFRVNLTSFLVFSAIFPALFWLLDPLFNQLGFWLLTHPDLNSLWNSVMQSSFGQSLALNNTLAISSLLLSLVLLFPLVVLAKKLVLFYRENLKHRVERWHIVQVVKTSKFYQYYQSIS